jgi:hypothetical protein
MDAERQFINSEALYCQAIENADGVPFQLIFGPRAGEGYYLNIGSVFYFTLPYEKGQ